MTKPYLIFCAIVFALLVTAQCGGYSSCSSCNSCVSCVSGPPNYMCPTPPNSLEVYFPHESFCTRFYKCVNGNAVEGRCPSGTFFNPQQNLCCPDESLCYRSNACVMQVAECANCANLFVKSNLMASAFFLCNCDGTATTLQCPTAFDTCANATVTLEFINGNCDPPPMQMTTTTESTTTESTTTESTTTESTTTESTTTESGENGGGGGGGGGGGD
ncbi:uncharacterized protein LOC135697639 [Ochlerotatus camptorhynchus]|uniref:uncharacterized protein LOC135697639 n=1 Tax=Ochlerotatus camptorhynchus TaxID=644619 RepID=UPI0031DB4A4C